jgi:class 3 adenylate cyclase/YHS domain-containing protein
MLTQDNGDEDAADLATRFAQMTRAVLGPCDRLIKTLGDAVLVTCADPVAALGFVDRLLTRAAEEPGFPALRAGLHHGPAIEREGDVFGAAVNLAARVAAEAYSGEVLATEPIADAARDEGIAVVELGPVIMKNVRGAIELSSLGFMVGGGIDSAIDPVCQAIVDRRAAAGELRHRDLSYWFCSLACAAAFASNPQWHVADGNTKRRR